jgi:repressor LexA
MAYSKPGQTRRKIYHFVRTRILSGDPPTIREVQQEFGFRSVQTAREHLQALVSEGLLEQETGRARGYRLPKEPGIPSFLIPLLGRVQAGALTTAVEDLEGYITVQSRFGEDELFGLRVQGESMINAGILPGDIVVVRKQQQSDPGQIIVALVDDEATVKRFRRKGNNVVLQPENPDFESIVLSPQQVTILGKVIEVRRYLEPPSYLQV